MTRYRVPVEDKLLLELDSWLPVEGFRLISVDGPWLAHPNITICTFEDDDAPPELEGKLVEPTLQSHYQDGEQVAVTVLSRTVVSGP